MKQILVMGLAIALCSGVAAAQPTPAPKPAPTPAPAERTGPVPTPDQTPTPAPNPNAKPDVQTEKVDKDESLEKGDDTRPWATGVSRDRQRKALERFRDANAQLNLGLFADAVKLYREALTHWDHPAINYNLALALLNLDQPLEVYDHLQRAIKYGPEPLETEKFEHAQKYLKLVEQQIATVEVTCKKPGAKISVDGKEVFTVGPNGEGGFFRGRVKIGKHTFVAEKPGYNAEVEAPFIGPGEVYRIELRLFTAEELTRYRRRWNTTWMPYAVIGGGAALGLVGGIFSLSAKSSYEDFDTEVARCNTESGGGGCTDQAVMDLRDSGDTKKAIGYVGYGIAGAAVVTGLVMVYLNRAEAYQITADEYRKEAREKEKAKASITFSPMVTPDAGGAMVFGRF